MRRRAAAVLAVAGSAFAAGCCVRVLMAGDTAAVLVKAERMPWQPAAGLAGARESVLAGAPSGVQAAMHSWDALLKGRVETHRSDTHIVVIAGTLFVNVTGRASSEIARGSYAMIPAGVEFTLVSGNQGETVFYVHRSGAAEDPRPGAP